jgi:transcription termination factor Rho
MAIIRKKKKTTEIDEASATDPSSTEAEGGNGSGNPGLDSQVPTLESENAESRTAVQNPEAEEPTDPAGDSVKTGESAAMTSHPPKRSKKKLRVELIKEGEQGEEQSAEVEAQENTDSTAEVQVSAEQEEKSIQSHSHRGGKSGHKHGGRDKKVGVENREKLNINDLTVMNMRELRKMAADMGVNHENLISMKKQEIIFSILKMHTERSGQIYATGALEILPD